MLNLPGGKECVTQSQSSKMKLYSRSCLRLIRIEKARFEMKSIFSFFLERPWFSNSISLSVAFDHNFDGKYEKLRRYRCSCSGGHFWCRKVENELTFWWPLFQWCLHCRRPSQTLSTRRARSSGWLTCGLIPSTDSPRDTTTRTTSGKINKNRITQLIIFLKPTSITTTFREHYPCVVEGDLLWKEPPTTTYDLTILYRTLDSDNKTHKWTVKNERDIPWSIFYPDSTLTI